MTDEAADDHVGLLVEHARRALIHELGATKIDVWLGKDGLVQHDLKEVAVVVIEALRPLLTTRQARDQTARLLEEGLFASPAAVDPNDW